MSVDTLPLITIGITSFNSLKTLPRALQSALGQTYENIEIVIVDDGSTDGSVDYLKSMQSEHDRIRFFQHHQNTGCAGARNTIINNAKGEFIAFFDDDDESMPERVSAQYHRIRTYEQKSGADLVFCYVTRIVRINENPSTDKEVRAAGYSSPEPNGLPVADYILLHLETQGMPWGPMGIGTSLSRTATYQKLGLFDPAFRRSEEWDLALRAALQGAHFISVDAPLMIQNITFTEDKARDVSLSYALMLRKKYKNYLVRRHSYWASVCCAYARSRYSQDQIRASRFWTFLSILTSPSVLLPFHFKRKMGIR